MPNRRTPYHRTLRALRQERNRLQRLHPALRISEYVVRFSADVKWFESFTYEQRRAYNEGAPADWIEVFPQ